MAERENYYLILDLDPTVSDQENIDARIREKQLEWSNAASTGVGAKARTANLYKGMLADIRRVMSDPAARAAEAAAARKRRKAGQAEADADLERHIAAICANSQFTGEQLKRLQNQFRATHDPTEVERRLAKRCPRKAANRSGKRQSLETIERTDQTKLTQNLKIVGKRDLYELLGAGHTTPAATLHAEADRRNREILARNQTTPEAAAAKELCGLAMKLFATDAGKQRYDNALSLTVMEGMRSIIQASVSNGRITAKALDRLVRDAAKQGMERIRARDFIVELAEDQGWFVDDDAPATTADYPQCSICGAIAERADQPNCGSCGHPFQIPCGKCGKPVAVANTACPHCGASVADAALMLDLLRQAGAAMTAGDWPVAAERLARVEATWPGWTAAAALQQRLDARRDSQDQALAAVKALISQRRLYEARDNIDRERSTLGGQFAAQQRADLTKQLDRAEQAYQAAAQAERAGRADDAFDGYAAAAQIAADHPGVASALARMPPPAPSALQVAPAPVGFALSWPPVRTRGRISYRIVASGERPPRDADEGNLIAETEETSLTDAQAPVGLPWYYAVFSLRAGIPSNGAARGGPHLRTAEVDALRAEPGAGSITLNWEPPANCLGVVARRQEGEVPRTLRDGTALECGKRALQDTGLADGHRYGYRIAVQFADPHRPASRITTAGIGISACPQQPPPAIDDLVQHRDGDTIRLSWTAPANVQVQLRRGPYPGAFAAQQIIALDQADRLGEALPIHGPGQAQLSLQGSGSFQVTPLSVRGGLAVVGQGVRITNIADVTAPHCRVAGRSILLTWGWPAGIDIVRVCYRTDRSPQSPDEPGAIAVDVPRARYYRQDGQPLVAADAKPHYFRLFAKAPDGDAWSGGVSLSALFGQQPLVESCIRIKRDWLRRVREVSLVLQSKNVTELRDLVVIVARGQLPLNPNSGELAGRWPEVQLDEGSAELPIPEHQWGRDRYARAFLLSGGGGIQLRPGGKAQMRLG